MEIEIGVVVGTANDGIMMAEGIAECQIFVSAIVPPLYHDVVGQRIAVVINHISPKDSLLSFAFQVFRHLCRKPQLQVMAVFQTQVGDSFLTVRAFVPIVFGSFISSQMDVRRGEQGAYFV